MSTNEKAIRARIQEIEDTISELNAECRALRGILYSQAAESRSTEITNRRSYRRIYNEEKIREGIRSKKDGMSYKDVYIYLTRMGVSTKESTVRSYLTRMAENGLVKNNKKTGKWILEDK